MQPKAAFTQNLVTEQIQCLSEMQAKFSSWDVAELILREEQKAGNLAGRVQT